MKRKAGPEGGFLPVSWRPSPGGTEYKIGTGIGRKTLLVTRKSRERRTKR